MKITPSLTNAIDCMNLRPESDATSTRLIPVGLPETIANGDLKPFYSHRHSSGNTTLFLTSGNFIYCLPLDDSTATPKSIAVLPSLPTCAVSSGDTLLIMTADGPFRLDYNPSDLSWTELGLMPQFPTINLRAISTTQISVTSSQCALLGEYTHWSGQLESTDEVNLNTDLKNLYTSLCDKASLVGLYVQPVIAHYQLFDNHGNMLYKSAPILISAPNGLQAVDLISASVVAENGVYSRISNFKLTATAFTIGFDVPDISDTPWDEIVASVKIMVTPQIHPIDFSAPASYRLETDDTSALIKAYLPGVARSMTPDTSRCTNIIKCLVANLDSSSQTLGTFNNPFTSGFSIIRFPLKKVFLNRLDRNTAQSECSVATRLLTSTDITADTDYGQSLLNSASLPNRFTAGTASAIGDIIAYGNITPIRYSGYPATMFASELTNEAWYANIKVTFADGKESVVWHGEGTTSAPHSFSPLLSYPDTDAIEMTLTVNYSDGTTLSRTVELSPIGSMSIFIDETLAPFLLDTTQEAYVIPSANTKTNARHGCVTSAPASSPLNLSSALHITQGKIVAITPAVRSSSAWDFARSHLYAFSTTGIYAVAINSSRSAISANIIDARKVYSHDAVTFSESGAYVIASGALLRISGSKSTTIDTQTSFKSIGWCSSFNELWCVNATNNMVTIRASDKYYRRDIVADVILSSLDGSLFILSNGVLMNCSREQQPESINVSWLTRIKTRNVFAPPGSKYNRPTRLKLISWHIFSAAANISLSLRGDNGAGDNSTYPLLKLIASGSINAPISTRIYAPPRLYLTLAIEGTASPDTSFSEIRIIS